VTDILNYTKSEEIFSAAQQLMPGGVSSPVRAFKSVGGQPIVFDRVKGPFAWDIDGNRYIDFIGSWGPAICGHAHPEVTTALQEAIEKGTSFGAPCVLENQLAEMVIDAVPSVEMVRFVNSGTEACMAVLRLMRAFTGRDKVIKFDGCYHGHADMFLVKAGSGVATLGLPDSPGVPRTTTANTLTAPYNDLEAVKNGARQLECTINGIGERAGNASLEELVMALHVRKSFFNNFLKRNPDSPTPLTAIRTEEITKTSRLVSNLTGMTVQPNKAIVGANAFAHESGIHQDGVLKNRLTYEIIDAKTVGLSDNKISLGKLSGRSAVRARLEEMGYDLSREDLNDAFARFKDLADRKREITDRDLEAIVSEQVQLPEAKFQISLVQVSCGNASKPTATISLLNTEDNTEDTAVSIGTGPVDAVCEALNKLAKVPNELIEFSVKSVTEGIDALGEVTIRIRSNKKIYSGHSADTDVVVAAANAYVNALNRLVFSEKKNSIHPQFDNLENSEKTFLSNPAN